MQIDILRFETIDSTNSEAIRRARAGAAEGLCIVARQQTAGRGRRGRTWVSKKDAGLYLSLLLRPPLESRYLPLITLMAGVAVHETLKTLGIEPDIKWVNDVLVGNDKIAGILSEAIETDQGLSVIVGVGINLVSTSFPADLKQTATSIELETGETPKPEELASDLLSRLTHYCEILYGSGGPRAIIDEWRKRSSYGLGKHVRVKVGSQTIVGLTDGLEDTGALRIKKDDGSVAIIQAGEVEQLRQAR